LQWNLANPAHHTRFGRRLPGHTSYAQLASVFNSVAFSPDGRTLAAGSNFGLVWLWNFANPAHPTRFDRPLTEPGLARIVYSVAFSPDGKMLAVGLDDRTVRLWNLANPAHPTSLGQPLTGPASPVSSMAFSPDGRTLAAVNHTGTAQIRNLDVDNAIQRICATTSNTLTPAQWKQYLPELPYDPPCAHPGRYGLLH
jgi:WD40 repeat protein